MGIVCDASKLHVRVTGTAPANASANTAMSSSRLCSPHCSHAVTCAGSEAPERYQWPPAHKFKLASATKPQQRTMRTQLHTAPSVPPRLLRPALKTKHQGCRHCCASGMELPVGCIAQKPRPALVMRFECGAPSIAKPATPCHLAHLTPHCTAYTTPSAHTRQESNSNELHTCRPLLYQENARWLPFLLLADSTLNRLPPSISSCRDARHGGI